MNVRVHLGFCKMLHASMDPQSMMPAVNDRGDMWVSKTSVSSRANVKLIHELVVGTASNSIACSRWLLDDHQDRTRVGPLSQDSISKW